jgi:Immunity protein 42
MGLGYFNVLIDGHRYGVRKADATALGCSYFRVLDRISDRGRHSCEFAMAPAEAIASAYIHAVFEKMTGAVTDVGLPQIEVEERLYGRRCIWAPDGDEAFDDRSHILQFDIKSKVRLIGFTRDEPHPRFNATTLSDITIEADEYYKTLADWSVKFYGEWMEGVSWKFNGDIL